MQTVKFTKLYKHKIDALRTAHYPAGAELEVNEEVAKAARAAGALEEEKNGRGSSTPKRASDDIGPQE